MVSIRYSDTSQTSMDKFLIGGWANHFYRVAELASKRVLINALLHTKQSWNNTHWVGLLVPSAPGWRSTRATLNYCRHCPLHPRKETCLARRGLQFLFVYLQHLPLRLKCERRQFADVKELRFQRITAMFRLTADGDFVAEHNHRPQPL